MNGLNDGSVDEMRGYVLIVAASVLWGSMGIFAKLAYGFGISPVPLIALRLVIGFATLFVILSVFHRSSFNVRRADVGWFLVLGVFAVTLQRLTYFYTIDFTTPTVAAILFYTYPVFVVLLAAVFFGERLVFWEFVAMVLTFVGVAFVVRAYDVAALRVNFLGIVLGLVASLLFVLYFMLVRRLRRRYAGWALVFYGEGVGTLVMLPVLFVSFPEMVGFPWELWVLVFVIAWFPSILAYLLYSTALKYVKAKGSILSVIEPLSAAVFSAIVLGERLEGLQVFGVVLALFGVVLLLGSRKAAR
ncbi:MAG: DMT family transporter [Candidatus Bathyarchaeia archaeon]|nr:DMT family transporter [Candidatus Bathyarchaeota archaeon A05DMB-4]MDH7595190.1 DMT family transporter [Candidatus Bathyarchaeota archaeon]